MYAWACTCISKVRKITTIFSNTQIYFYFFLFFFIFCRKASFYLEDARKYTRSCEATLANLSVSLILTDGLLCSVLPFPGTWSRDGPVGMSEFSLAGIDSFLEKLYKNWQCPLKSI